MNIHLVVVRDFVARLRGDVITKPEEIEEVLSSENADCVVRVMVPDHTGEG